jgi:ABC-type transport system involved in multi-copper enzyme maturation permease subunit
MTTERATGFARSVLDQPWGLWWLQTRRLVRIELQRNLFSWKAAWIYFLAFAPTGIILIHLLFETHPAFALTDDTNVLAGIVQFYYIRLGVCFGCLGIFARLIRGEMIERSLHFYLLAPLRREILLLGKFAAGSISALLLFGHGATTLTSPPAVRKAKSG